MRHGPKECFQPPRRSLLGFPTAFREIPVRLLLPLGLCVAAAAALSPANAQQRKGRCTGETPDSAWLAAGPVYRDCEVDRKASLRGSPPKPQLSAGARLPNKECYHAGFEFVVDTSGVPELGTVRPHPRNDQFLEDAVRAQLPQLRYEPARRDGLAVRQLVVFEQSVGVMFRVSVSGRPSEPANPRPPRC